MATPRQPPDFDALLRRARAARSAHDDAEREWHTVRDELRAVAEAGTLPREVRDQVADLLRDEEPAHAHRRWRPAPS